MRFLGRLFYYQIQLWGWILRLIPHSIKNLLASTVAYFWLHVVGFRRRIVLLNLAACFPRKAEESSVAFSERIYALARANLKNYFLGFCKIVEKTTWSEKTLQKKVIIQGMEHMQEVMKDGTGVFFLSSHLGNWEATLALSRRMGRPLYAIARHVRNPFWDETLRMSREKFDIVMLPEVNSGIAAMKAYKKGGLVPFMLDQHTGEPHGVLARFFGLKAWTQKGLAVLSGRLGAKILPIYTYRKDGKIHVVIEAPLQMDDLGECREPQQILEHVQRCNNKIEEWVRKFPEQYFWIHRRFKAEIDYKNDRLPFAG